jgi:hypothetical protein
MALIDATTTGKDNETIKKIIRAYGVEPPCKYWVGDTVYFSQETKNYVIDKYGRLGGWDSQADNLISEFSHVSNPLEIIGVTKYDKNIDTQWWFLCKGNDQFTVWMSQESLLPRESSVPNYRPKKLDKTLESRNSIEEADEIMILLRNIDELDTLYDTIRPLGYIINKSFFRVMEKSKHPINIFINIKTGEITQLTDMEKSYDISKNPTLNGVWNRELTIENIQLIKKILETKKLLVEPSYKSRNIRKMNEEMAVPYYMPETPPELSLEKQKELYKVGDIVIVRPDAFDYFNDVDPGEMARFFGRKVKIVGRMTTWDQYGDEDPDAPNDLLLTVVSADESFPNTDRWYWLYKCLYVPEYKPSYKPRKISRDLNEKLSEINFSHIPSPVLSPEQQKLQYKIGDTVIIRPDAFDYFYDVNESMKEVLGKEGDIVEIEFANEIYGDYAPEKGKGMTEQDMIITVETDSDPEDNRWYWFYRCLANPKFIVPSYKPRHHSEGLMEAEQNFRLDYEIDSEKYKERFNEPPLEVIPIEKIEEFYDVKFEDYLNDLYLNESFMDDFNKKRELLEKGEYDCIIFDIDGAEEAKKAYEYFKDLKIIGNVDRLLEKEHFVLLTKDSGSLDKFMLYPYSSIYNIREHMMNNWRNLNSVSPIMSFDEVQKYINSILGPRAVDMYKPKKIQRDI